MTDWWFFALLLVNLVVVAVYLLWFLLFKPEQDNRAQFIMQAVIMTVRTRMITQRRAAAESTSFPALFSHKIPITWLLFLKNSP